MATADTYRDDLAVQARDERRDPAWWDDGEDDSGDDQDWDDYLGLTQADDDWKER